VVLTELLSDPKVTRVVKDLFLQLPVLDITEGYWHRTGLLRSRLLARGRRARLADGLIAQSCLDQGPTAGIGLPPRRLPFRLRRSLVLSDRTEYPLEAGDHSVGAVGNQAPGGPGTKPARDRALWATVPSASTIGPGG
jgi:hypothetical protein